MRIRNYEDTDYPIIKNWAQEREFIGMDEDFIPKESSFIAEDWEGRPKAFLCMVETNTRALGIVSGLIANPELPPEARGEAAELLTNFMVLLAKQRGIKALAANIESPGGEKHAVNCGLEPQKGRMYVRYL